MRRTVVALGGNALLEGGDGSVADQRRNVRETRPHLAALAERDRELVLTHGNGPQVGALLLQNEASDAPEMPLDVLVAETQAQIGHLLGSELDDALGRTTTVLTRVRVDADDPRMDDPTKPVGPYYDADEAASKPFETTRVSTDDGDDAYRRVVPSPRPQSVLEAERIADAVDAGSTVVCGGGGGVPVVPGENGPEGVEAVVDKDYTSRLVADAVDADELVMLTDVDAVYEDFGEESETRIAEATPGELRERIDAGEFPAGSMRPKARACAEFVAGDDGGDLAVITSPANLEATLDGDAGTRVVRPSRDR